MSHGEIAVRPAPLGLSRLDSEREWHNRHFGRKQERRYEIDPAVVRRYFFPERTPLFYKELMFRLAGDLCGKRVLVVGCGDDSVVSLLAMAGAEVFAFDISEQAVSSQMFQAAANGVQSHVRLAVGAAEQMPWPGERFDVIWGSMILHHLPEEIGRVADEVLGRLAPDGVALFAEPIVFSGAMRRLRRAVPVHTDISPGERQLEQRDVAPLAERFAVRTRYLRLLARLHKFTLHGPLETAPAPSRWATLALAWADKVLLAVPALHRFAGTAVFELRHKESR